MYQAHRNSDAMPGPAAHTSDMPSFVQLPDSPSASSPSSSTNFQQTFLERINQLPLVRAALSRIQEVYDNTKDRHDLLRGVLEQGENTVAYSLSRAADVLTKSGISSRLQKPLSLADSSACFVLDRVESKLPIITKSTYEIKLMISDNVESKMDRLTAVKDSTVRLYDDYKSFGTQTIEEAKQIGAEKVQAVLETPVGQKLNQTLEHGLTVADSVVDRFLPEDGHSHKNGNGNANGQHPSYYSNGVHTGTLDHAKSLSRKVRRRVSAKSNDVVDSLMQNAAVSTVKKNIDSGRQMAKTVSEGVYFSVATVTGKVVDVWYSTVLFFLPQSLQAKFTVVMDGIVEKLLSVRRRSSVSMQ